MENNLSRRNILKQGSFALGTAVLGTTLGASTVDSAEVASTPPSSTFIKIVGINGSPRRDKTTFESLKIALDAAKAVAPNKIQTEIVQLTDYDLFNSERVYGGAAIKGAGNYSKLEEKLADPAVRGILVGSPVHNSMQSVLIAAFFAQINHSVLQGKVGGALAVGGARNGGQESVVTCLNTFLFHEGVILPGTGKAGRIGALLWNQKDSVATDEAGIKLAKVLAERIAKVALALPGDLLK